MRNERKKLRKDEGKIEARKTTSQIFLLL